MSVLSAIEKQKFEELFGMSSGYVLKFTDRTFADFFQCDVGIDIYDARYACNGTSKAKRLRLFWDIEKSEVVGKALERLLEMARYHSAGDNNERADRLYDDCTKIVSRLLGRAVNKETESDFLKRDLGAISIEGLDLDYGVERILDARVKEAVKCVETGAPLSAIFMCGSILEGVLLAVALKNPADFNRATASPKHKDTAKVRPFQEWSLANLIDVAHEVGVLRLDVKKFGHVVRDFRNYIHPYEQMASTFHPDQHTAQICLQVLRAALAGLKANRGAITPASA